MNQSERRYYLIQELINEKKEYRGMEIPDDLYQQKILLRSLMNIRMPDPISEEFLKIQDDYLKEELQSKGITDCDDLEEIEKGLYLWQGDITTLRCDAIVNAANSNMLGCFQPCHNCIDNCIHTYAGIQLRLECNEIMTRQGHTEETGKAKMTDAYNLPCKKVIHTVGPIVQVRVTKSDQELLKSCYLECLRMADVHHLESIAFCCISTGVFSFPNKLAAKIAIDTVREYMTGKTNIKKVIFNVFKNEDKDIYQQLLG